MHILDITRLLHRLPSVWGEDAHIWRPERFLEGVESTQKISLGVIANLCEIIHSLHT